MSRKNGKNGKAIDRVDAHSPSGAWGRSFLWQLGTGEKTPKEQFMEERRKERKARRLDELGITKRDHLL